MLMVSSHRPICKPLRTPVVLVSGDPPEPSTFAVRRDACAWMPKPYDRAPLLRTIMRSHSNLWMMNSSHTVLIASAR